MNGKINANASITEIIKSPDVEICIGAEFIRISMLYNIIFEKEINENI